MAYITTEDYCMFVEACEHTVGFGDGKGKYSQQTTYNVKDSDVAKVLKNMTGPKATFTTGYYYFNPNNCCDCPENVQKVAKTAGKKEMLHVEGVGVWTK